MAKRYWKTCWNMGYAGTETIEEIDLLNYVNGQEELDKLSDEEANTIIYDIIYEEAASMIDIYVEEADNNSK